VRAEIDVPVNDSNLSYEGFRRCLYCLLTAVDEEYPEMMRLMWGADGARKKRNDPSSSGPGEGGKGLRKPRI